jgi:copper chaperone CopZ
MKTASYFVIAFLLVTSACGESGKKKIISVEKKEVLKQPVQVMANREMSIEVEGMSCEHACGGAIRMALKETGAVDRCSFDFKEDRAKNTAFITFDKDKISADKIISIIEKLNDNQFTTSNPSTKTMDKVEAAPSATSTSNETSLLPRKSTPIDEVSEYAHEDASFEFPNLLELFSNLVSL